MPHDLRGQTPPSSSNLEGIEPLWHRADVCLTETRSPQSLYRDILQTQIWPDNKQILRLSKILKLCSGLAATEPHMPQLRHRSHIVYISHRSPHRFLLPLLACPRPSSLQPHQASHLHTAASLRTHLQAFPFLESDRDRNTWLLREELEDLEWRIHLG